MDKQLQELFERKKIKETEEYLQLEQTMSRLNKEYNDEVLKYVYDIIDKAPGPIINLDFALPADAYHMLKNAGFNVRSDTTPELQTTTIKWCNACYDFFNYRTIETPPDIKTRFNNYIKQLMDIIARMSDIQYDECKKQREMINYIEKCDEFQKEFNN